jgi:hypothetical protein
MIGLQAGRAAITALTNAYLATAKNTPFPEQGRPFVVQTSVLEFVPSTRSCAVPAISPWQPLSLP